MLYSLVIISSTLIISSLAANCCIDAPDVDTCGDVDSSCLWIDDTDTAALAKSSGIQCVTDSWYKCEVDGICPPPPPVPPVPSECVFNACENNEESYNIAFLIDESGSVGRTNYVISLNFIEKMVENDINDVSKISMLAFASGLDRIYHFSDSQNDQRAGALEAIRQEKLNFNSGGTCTATALREAANEFRTSTTVEENNILILMTDGYPNCGGNVCDEKAALDALGVEIYIVGVGGGFSKNAVQCLVDEPKDDYILTIPKFTQQLFFHMEAQLRRVVCPASVFKHYAITQKLYEFVGLNGSQTSNNYLYMAGCVALIVAALIYYFRAKICKKDEKYVALTEDKQYQYQSV